MLYIHIKCTNFHRFCTTFDLAVFKILNIRFYLILIIYNYLYKYTYTINLIKKVFYRLYKTTIFNLLYRFIYISLQLETISVFIVVTNPPFVTFMFA